MNKPENTSPSGIREIGIGPNEYKIPTPNESPPSRSTSQPVCINKMNPEPIATINSTTINNATLAEFMLYCTIALCDSYP
ncbi:hypothetical protein D3C77_516330 [compost metagenome]